MSPDDTDGAETAACQLCPARLAQSATQLLGQGLSELIPPEAQRHLLNAQRELLLAAMATIEHNTSRGSRTPAPRARKRSTTAKRSPRTRRPSRVELD